MAYLRTSEITFLVLLSNDCFSHLDAMLNFLSFFYRQSRRRFLYPLVSAIVAVGLVVAAPLPSKAISWIDLLIQGAQIVQLSNISDKQEYQIGRDINQQLVSSEIRILRNPGLSRYVDQIGQRLAQESDRPDIPYTFQVVADKGVNAFATMGGFVYVNAGLLTGADNEAELASVISHEIGHITGRHAIKQMRQMALARGVAQAAGLDRSMAVQIGVDLALRRPKSRQDELDADRRGLATLERAGYAPSAMVGFMEKLLSAPSVPTVLSTHPATKDRIVALERAIEPNRANVGDGLNNVAYKAKLRSYLGS